MTDARPGNAADPKQVSEGKAKAKRGAMRDEDALRAVLDTREGRRVLWRRLERAGVFTVSHVPGDAYQTAYNEGRRSEGLALLLEILGLDPQAYTTMTAEAAHDKEHD